MKVANENHKPHHNGRNNKSEQRICGIRSKTRRNLRTSTSNRFNRKCNTAHGEQPVQIDSLASLASAMKDRIHATHRTCTTCIWIWTLRALSSCVRNTRDNWFCWLWCSIYLPSIEEVPLVFLLAIAVLGLVMASVGSLALATATDVADIHIAWHCCCFRCCCSRCRCCWPPFHFYFINIDRHREASTCTFTSQMVNALEFQHRNSKAGNWLCHQLNTSAVSFQAAYFHIGVAM